MLILTRKVGQKIVIAGNIEIVVVKIRDDQVRIGIEAPRSIPVHRKELQERLNGSTSQPSFDDGEE